MTGVFQRCGHCAVPDECPPCHSSVGARKIGGVYEGTPEHVIRPSEIDTIRRENHVLRAIVARRWTELTPDERLEVRALGIAQ